MQQCLLRCPTASVDVVVAVLVLVELFINVNNSTSHHEEDMCMVRHTSQVSGTQGVSIWIDRQLRKLRQLIQLLNCECANLIVDCCPYIPPYWHNHNFCISSSITSYVDRILLTSFALLFFFVVCIYLTGSSSVIVRM